MLREVQLHSWIGCLVHGTKSMLKTIVTKSAIQWGLWAEGCFRAYYLQSIQAEWNARSIWQKRNANWCLVSYRYPRDFQSSAGRSGSNLLLFTTEAKISNFVLSGLDTQILLLSSYAKYLGLIVTWMKLNWRLNTELPPKKTKRFYGCTAVISPILIYGSTVGWTLL